MKKLFAVALVMSVLMTGCFKARVKEVNTTRYEDKITYFQDQNTYAVFAIVVIKTGANLTEDGIGLAYIPKNEVTLAIKNKISNYQE